jgi:hypothetical protein
MSLILEKLSGLSDRHTIKIQRPWFSSDGQRDVTLGVLREYIGSSENVLAALAADPAAARDAIGAIAADPETGKLPADKLPDDIDARMQVLSGTDAALSAEVLSLGELAAPTDKAYLRRGNGATAGGTPTAGGVHSVASGSFTTTGGVQYSLPAIPLLPGLNEVSLLLIFPTLPGGEEIDISATSSSGAVESFCVASVAGEAPLRFDVLNTDAPSILFSLPGAKSNVGVRIVAQFQVSSAQTRQFTVAGESALSGSYRTTSKLLA